MIIEYFQAYLILGIALILEAFSIYYSTPAFWAVFCIVYVVATVSLATNIYNSGIHRRDRFLVVHAARMWFTELRKLFGRVKTERGQVGIICSSRCRRGSCQEMV